MEVLNGQKCISRSDIWFDLKEIISGLPCNKLFLLTDIDYEDSYLHKYFSELKTEIVLEKRTFTDEYEEISEAVNSFRKSGCSMIAAIGSSKVIQTAKAVKLFSRLESSADYLNQLPAKASSPMLAVPTTIECGAEANGLLTINKDGVYYDLYDENAKPEFILHDSNLIVHDNKAFRNDGLASAMGTAMTIIWNSDIDTHAAQLAAGALLSVLDNMMPYLRGDSSSFTAMQKAVFDIGKASDIAGVQPIDRLVRYFSDHCNLNFKQTKLMITAPLIMAVEERFMKLNITSFDKKDLRTKGIVLDKVLDGETLKLFNKLKFATQQFVPGNPGVNFLHSQIAFWGQLLEIPHPSDLNNAQILEFSSAIDRSIFAGWATQYTDEELDFICLQFFNKLTLGYLFERCARTPEKFVSVLAEVNERYNDDLSPERIIADPFHERRELRRKLVDGLQKLTLETLVLTRDFLEKNGLRFYLSEGTLLGAIRHGGFIPWDDDVDIMMPREDYDKLLKLSNEGKFPPELHFDSLENNPNHWVLGAKIQLTRQTNFIQHKVTRLSEYDGPYVDVFPLDYWNSPFTKAEFRAQRTVKMCRRLLFMKTGYSTKTNGKLHRILMRIAVPFIPQSLITKTALQNMKKFNDGKRKFFVHLCSYYPYYKEVFPVGAFGDPVTVKFEGHEMPVPREYDFILRTIYGTSYDKVPPQHITRMRRHSFELVSDDDNADD